jgi:VIT1/CCC1 family predicted Fe2+/Mn2+ transporter
VQTRERAAASSRGAVLDPIERLSEILFGLIMAMTFTGAIRAALAGSDRSAEGAGEEIRVLLFGAVGCNVAWGIVDAVMYVITTRAAVHRRRQVLRRLKAAREPAEADSILSDELPDALTERLRPEELSALRAWFARLPDQPESVPIDRRVLRGALGVFLLVALTTFPLVVPFLVFGDPLVAVRVSHGIALLMLFLCGYALGRFAGQGPLRTGASMVAIGVGLVGLTIFLGG